MKSAVRSFPIEEEGIGDRASSTAATMQEQRSPQNSGAAGKQSTGTDALSLADWLDVAWFYPEDFRKERIVETSQSLLVFGESIVYKFLKSNTPNRTLSFGQRWAIACEEVLDNRELAPDLYLGLRLLRWIEDEPHWITEYRGSDLRPAVAPEHADEVAIVMRRIPDKSKLSDYLLDNGELQLDQLQSLLSQVTRFHTRRMKRARRIYASEPAEGVAILQHTILERLSEFSQEYAGYLDPFSQLALTEAAHFLRGSISRNRGLLEDRVREGFFVDAHGALRAHCMSIEPLSQEARSVSIFHRAPRDVRQQDVLADLASLAVDLELYDAGYLAREIERRYNQLLPAVGNAELYRFYLVAEAVRAATEYIQQLGTAQTLRATKAFSIALRYSLGLTQPFALFVTGSAEDDCEGLARALAELVHANYYEASLVQQGLSRQEVLDDFAFERLRERVERSIDEDEPVVACWPEDAPRHRFAFHSLAQSRNISYLLIRCDDYPSEASRSEFDTVDPPLLSPPELAIDVLRELARQMQQRMA